MITLDLYYGDMANHADRSRLDRQLAREGQFVEHGWVWDVPCQIPPFDSALLRQQGSAINRQHLAGDGACTGTGQPEHRLRDLVWPAEQP